MWKPLQRHCNRYIAPAIVSRAIALLGLSALIGGCAQSLRSTLPREPTPAELSELWVEPKDLETRDLFYGAGGRRGGPSSTAYELVKKDTTGFSPGYDVRDAQGLEWDVKLGVEAQSEVVSSRLLWVVGYHQPPTYYVPRWKLSSKGVITDEAAGRFRPDLRGRKTEGFWKWHENPFVHTRPFRGLIVWMVMLASWDLRDDNNTIYELDPPLQGQRRWFVVRDLGSSLGKAGFYPQGTKNQIDDFEQQGFVKGADGARARIDFNSRRYRGLFHDVAVEDVRWACGLLARLRDEQLDDAFRAAEYPPEQRARYIRKLRQRQQDGLKLGS